MSHTSSGTEDQAPVDILSTAPVFGLTRTQYELLCVVQELFEAFGRAPSLTEIQHEMSLVRRGAVHKTLVRLRERGYLDWKPYNHRSLVVLRPVAQPEEFEYVVRVE